MVLVMTPCVSTKQLGESSAVVASRAACSALAFEEDVDEDRLNRFIVALSVFLFYYCFLIFGSSAMGNDAVGRSSLNINW
jgi:hypothetical protein